MISGLKVFCAATAALLALAAPASAQEQAAGPFCGEVTWQGQAPIDTWVHLGRDNIWATTGAFSLLSDGTYAQDGGMLTMSGGETPQFQITASTAGGRVVGEVTASDGRRGVISMSQMRGTGAGLRSSSVPPNFVPEAAEEALAGDMQGLSDAMAWAWTPQGVDYWRAIHQSGQVPDHAADALRDWIRRARAGEQPVCDAQ